MKTVGVIAEYNPFHFGHKYLIDEAKKKTKADRVVVVMSGNSVQRGDFAIVDKFSRAKEAVRNGADLVLELPFCYSSQSAEYFAKGSIDILNSLGCIDYLCFGSEKEDLEKLSQIADILLDESINEKIKIKLKEGFSYPVARKKAVLESIGEASDVMDNPNDILAIEYIKRLKKLDSKIIPCPIKRVGSSYHDKEIIGNFPSATSIRTFFNSNTDSEYSKLNIKSGLSVDMLNFLSIAKENNNLMSMDLFFNELKNIIIREKNLSDIFEVGEGLDNLIKKNILKANTIDELIFSLKSKRYTYTRIRRILFNILIGLTKDDMKIVKKSDEISYVKLLAFNNNGRNILKNLENIVIKFSKYTPNNDLEKILQRYDKIVNDMFYSKYKYEHYNKLVVTENQMSPIFVDI